MSSSRGMSSRGMSSRGMSPRRDRAEYSMIINMNDGGYNHSTRTTMPSCEVSPSNHNVRPAMPPRELPPYSMLVATQPSHKYVLSEEQKDKISDFVDEIEKDFQGKLSLFELAASLGASLPNHEPLSKKETSAVNKIIEMSKTMAPLLDDEFPNEDKTLGTMRQCIANKDYLCTWVLAPQYIGKLRHFFGNVDKLEKSSTYTASQLKERDAKIQQLEKELGDARAQVTQLCEELCSARAEVGQLVEQNDTLENLIQTRATST